MKNALHSIFSIALFTACSVTALAQVTVTMTDGGQVTIPCDIPNDFLDGYNGAYGNNLDQTITVCVTPGTGLTVSFSFAAEEGGYFDIDPSDTLYVYDGPNINSPLIATLNNTSAPFGAATGNTTLANESGCITLQFVTDGSGTGQGFQGVINCNYSCQPIEPWFWTIPAIVPNDSSGSINVCLGDTVTFNALVNFPMSPAQGGTGYNQTMANSTLEWFIFGEPVQTGGSVTFVPDQRAGYFVDLLVTDTLGCFENSRTRVQVSTIPNFSETTILAEDTLCFGATTFLLGGVTTQDTTGVASTEGAFLNGGLFGESLELPDGSGTIEDIYTTTINITGFEPGDTISSGDDILNLCILMEHSYLSDLEMWLTCPGATDSIVIFNAYNGNSGAPGFIPGGFTPGTGINLGIPSTGSGQGTCYEYCFSLSENNFGTFASEYGGMGNTMTSGTYLPEETYANLIGCPLNGDWSLSVADSWPADDGWICEWGIIFHPDIDPNSETYIPAIVDGWWENSPDIISTSGDTLIEVLPPTSGDHFYTFFAEDNFGCIYDTTLQVHMVPPLGAFSDSALCSLSYNLSAADYEILGEWTYNGPLGGSATFSPNATDYNPTVTVDTYGPYTFIYHSDYCGQADSVIVQFNPTPSPVVLNDMDICPGTDVSFDALNSGIDADYTWTPNLSSGQVLNLDSVVNSVNVQVQVSNLCGTTNGSASVTVHSLNVTGPATVCMEDEADLIATLTTTGGEWTYTGPANGTATFTPNMQNATPSVTVTEPGEYEFTFTEEECALEKTWAVSFVPTPTIELSIDTNRICIENMATLTFSVNTDIYDEIMWTPYGGDNDTLLVAGTDSLAFWPVDTSFHVSVSIENFCGTDQDEVVFKVIDCTLDLPNVFNPESSIPENQFFNIVALELHPGNNVKIFDRWGRKCYDVDNYHLNPWRGDGAADGVYFYALVRPGYEAETGYVHLVRGSGQ